MKTIMTNCGRTTVSILGCSIIFLASLLSFSCIDAFVVTTTKSVGEKINGNINANLDPIVLRATVAGGDGASAKKRVELVPEPEGGEELTAIKTMVGSRMKNMGEATGLTGVRDADSDENEDGGTIYEFWLTANVDGKLIREIHSTVLKDSARKADFPGFRKGQVPPYAMPQIRGFSVEEGIVKTCQSVIDAYGLKSVSGSDGELKVSEDVPELAKMYKLGDDVQFTATVNARYDPAVQKQQQQQKVVDEETAEEDNTKGDDEDEEDDVVDVEYESYVDGKRIA